MYIGKHGRECVAKEWIDGDFYIYEGYYCE